MIRNRKNRVRIFNASVALNAATAKFIAGIAEKSVEKRGRFVLCLSGGNTPKNLYALLSTDPYRDIVPWKDTFVFWGDERCVPGNDERNNASMARKTLLDKTELPASHLFPVPVDLSPSDAAREYEKTLRLFFGQEPPRFDLILLGLGEDGHTASLFPGTSVIYEKTRWVKEVIQEGNPEARITLTTPLINQSRSVLFLVTGEAKSEILETVLTQPYQPEKYPAQMIDPEEGEITWFVDQKAASRLKDTPPAGLS
jgi:6-phosphogluconolactonase